MDRLKKKFGKGKNKEKKTKKSKVSVGKKASKTSVPTRKKEKRQSNESSSSSESQRKTVQNVSIMDAFDRKFNMAGSVHNKPKNSPDFALRLMKAECSELMNQNITVEECRLLDDYLRKKAELRSSDHVVIAETFNDDEKKTSRLKIVTKYDEGRFGAIYIVKNESAVDDNVVASSNSFMVMKTALRNVSSAQLVLRLNREIQTLNQLFATKDDLPKRIVPLLFDGRVLGVPFLVTQLLDVNLEKCREEMGGQFSMPSAFFIAQEIILAMKFVHRNGFVHRDIKPTNIVLNTANRNQFFLIDFGEAVLNDRKSMLSPADGYTLPFISRIGHDLMEVRAPNKYSMDVESWFYVFLDLLKPLPWRDINDLSSVKNAKKKFWEDIDAHMPLSDYPTQAIQLAKLVKTWKSDITYADFTKVLGDGFLAIKDANWTPDWIDRQMTAQLAKERRGRETTPKKLGAEASSTSVNSFVTPPKPVEEKKTKKNENTIAVVVPSSDRQTENNRRASKEAHDFPACPPPKESPLYVAGTNNVKKKDASVYADNFPVAGISNGAGAKPKYKYRAKKG